MLTMIITNHELSALVKRMVKHVKALAEISGLTTHLRYEIVSLVIGFKWQRSQC